MQLFRISRVDSSTSDNPHLLFRVSNMGRQLGGMLAAWLATIDETTTYTELDEYLADPLNEAQVRKLMTMHASSDFLFDWYLEDNTVIETVMESTIGAKWLGARDYVCDKFMANADAREVMLNAKGKGSLVPLIPVASANDSHMIASSEWNDGQSGVNHYKWQAFDNNPETNWCQNYFYAVEGRESWIGYQFDTATKVVKIHWESHPNIPANCTLAVDASNDGTTWTTLIDSATYTNVKVDFDVSAFPAYKAYRVRGKHNDPNPLTRNFIATILQFYGEGEGQNWQYILKDHVPTMTSNTSPYGEASASGSQTASLLPWCAFDNNNSTYWSADGITNAWIKYKFTNPICVKRFYRLDTSIHRTDRYTFEASNDNSTWVTLSSGTSELLEETVDINNNDYYLYYRLSMDNTRGYNIGLTTLQFYGRALNVSDNTPGNKPPKHDVVTINGVDYWTSYTEREFEEGSTIYYLYDHGVKVDSLSPSAPAVEQGQLIEDTGNELHVKVINNASATPLWWSSQGYAIDFSKYNNIRIKFGDRLVVKTTGFFSNVFNGTNLAVKTIAANELPIEEIPNDWCVPVSEINVMADTNIGFNGSNVGNEYDIVEWWLE